MYHVLFKLITAVKHLKLFEWLHFQSYSGLKQWTTHPDNSVLIRWALADKKNLQRTEGKSRCQRFHVITLSSVPSRKSSTNADKETFEIIFWSSKDVFAFLNWFTSFSREVWRSFSFYFRCHILTCRYVISCPCVRPQVSQRNFAIGSTVTRLKIQTINLTSNETNLKKCIYIHLCFSDANFHPLINNS